MSTSILHEKACLLLCTPLINSMGPAILGWKHSIHVLYQECKRVVLNVFAFSLLRHSLFAAHKLDTLHPHTLSHKQDGTSV